MKHLIILLGLLIAFAGLATARAQTADALPPIKIYLVGDSTVTPDAGWGNGFIACLKEEAKVTNTSRGGRSSKSFINEGRWKEVLDAKPDYVLIQFGHNDQKLNDPARGTDPETTYRQYMNQYVDEAIAHGIKPILVTSLSRRQWAKDSSSKIESTLAPYANVVKEIAKQKNVPLIDLHARSIELYEKLGKAEINTMSPTKPATQLSDDPSEKAATVLDGTHLNAKGSAIVGKIVAEEMAKVVPALAPYVKTN